jgi:CheY-like chemotaxis protein
MSDVRILYIEDNEINRFVLEKSMGKYARVTSEENGFKGIDLAIREEYDFVLIDLNLADPKIDGFGVLKALQEANVESIPVAVTAFTGSDWEQKCKKAGFDLFFSKPINAKDIWQELVEFKKRNKG